MINKKIIYIILFLIFGVSSIYSQDQDTTKSRISSGISSDHFKPDSLLKREQSPLDIADDRGLYILTPDGKMQLRILGSVRFSALYDMVEVPIKKSFNTYFIPTGDDNVKVPNYYNSLGKTRFGFEVTRKLETKRVFVRLETDFDGSNGQFRIRHAYGQIGGFLVGQTWSLFSNVSSLPSMLDGNGPTGSVTLRTPQIRYGGQGKRGVSWMAAIEYSTPDLTVDDLDTTGITTVQLLPDFTGRLVWEGILGIVQLSGVITTISKKDINNKVTNNFGFGGSLSGTVKIHNDHKLLYQFTYGKATSHFITTLSGTGNDAIYNPQTGEFVSLFAMGGFLSYGVDWPLLKLTSNLSAGYAELFSKDFMTDDYYRNSISISLDTFIELSEGARLGLEYVYGKRWNINGESGNVSRIWTLFYYDF